LHYRLVMQFQALDLPRVKGMRAALQPFLTHNVPINPGRPNQEPGFVELHRSYHDESPTIPCVLLFRWDGVDGVTTPDLE